MVVILSIISSILLTFEEHALEDRIKAIINVTPYTGPHILGMKVCAAVPTASASAADTPLLTVILLSAFEAPKATVGPFASFMEYARALASLRHFNCRNNTAPYKVRARRYPNACGHIRRLALCPPRYSGAVCWWSVQTVPCLN